MGYMAKQNLSAVEWQDRFSHQKSTLFGEDDFGSKGTKLQVIKFSPKGGIKPHFHKLRTEVFYVLKGMGVISLDGEDNNCKEDDFLLCKPGTKHAFTNIGDSDFVIAVFRTNDPGDSDMLWVNGNEE